MIYVWCSEMSKRRLRRRSGSRTPRTPRPSKSPAAVELRTVPIVQQAPHVERLAYTRSQAAEALGISRSTFIRRVLPHVETIEMPWGARLILVDELERLLAERRRAAHASVERAPPGRPPLGRPAGRGRLHRQR